MLDLWRGFRAIKYVFSQTLFTFIMVFFILTSIIFLPQSGDLINEFLVNQVPMKRMWQLTLYFYMNFLDITLPASLFLAVILVYRRLSDSLELIALKSLGLSNFHCMFPAIILGLLASLISAQALFVWIPERHQNVEHMIRQIRGVQPHMFIKEGVFSKFFDLTIYVSKVHKESQGLEGVFISKEAKEGAGLKVIAQKGRFHIRQDASSMEAPPSADLQLFDGTIYSVSEEKYTKTDFKEYEIRLSGLNIPKPDQKEIRFYSLGEMRRALNEPRLSAERKRGLYMEIYGRLNLALVNVLCALLGCSIVMMSHHRGKGTNSFYLFIGLTFIYWLLLMACRYSAEQNVLPLSLAMFLPNILLVIVASLAIRRLNQSKI